MNEQDPEPFDIKIKRFGAQLGKEFAASERLQRAIERTLEALRDASV